MRGDSVYLGGRAGLWGELGREKVGWGGVKRCPSFPGGSTLPRPAGKRRAFLVRPTAKSPSELNMIVIVHHARGVVHGQGVGRQRRVGHPCD